MMNIFDFKIASKNVKNTELYQKHFLNAINGLLASGCSDYDKVIIDASSIALKAVECTLQKKRAGIFVSLSELLKIK
jgi:hypothetical protein